MSTFVEAADLSHATVVPFVTSSSSPIGNSAKSLRAQSNGSTWKDGGRLDASASDTDVKAFVEKNGQPSMEHTAKRRRLTRRTAGVALLLAMVTLMSHQVAGGALHEWLGLETLALIVAHLVLNRRWFRALPKGRPTVAKVAIAVLDLALMASFAATIATGASMSEHAVPFLSGAIPGMGARALHLACSHWSMALVGLHVGIHWHPVVRALAKGRGRAARLVLLALGVAVAGFGLATFLRNDIVGYMAMSTPFASYDLSNPPALVLVENASVIALFAFASYHVTRIRYHVSNQRRRACTTRP